MATRTEIGQEAMTMATKTTQHQAISLACDALRERVQAHPVRLRKPWAAVGHAADTGAPIRQLWADFAALLALIEEEEQHERTVVQRDRAMASALFGCRTCEG